MNQSRARISRRHFLLASAGTAAAAAAVVANTKPETAASQDNGIDRKSGYQVTAHVRNYYRTAKI